MQWKERAAQLSKVVEMAFTWSELRVSKSELKKFCHIYTGFDELNEMRPLISHFYSSSLLVTFSLVFYFYFIYSNKIDDLFNAESE